MSRKIPLSPRISQSICSLCVWLGIAMLLCIECGCHLSAQGRNVDGVRSYQVGKYNQAIQHFQQAIAKDPNNANAHYNLAATYCQLGKYRNDPTMMNQAEGLYHQCLDLSPNHTDCYRGLAALLVDTNRPESAFTLLKRWTARSHNMAEPRIELARLYQEFGDQENATRHLTDALHLNPNSTRAWAALGSVREQQGQIAQAMANYQQAYNLNQTPGLAQRIASLQQNLAVSASRAGQPTQIVNNPGATPR